jgi:hypothetical protein
LSFPAAAATALPAATVPAVAASRAAVAGSAAFDAVDAAFDVDLDAESLPFADAPLRDDPADVFLREDDVVPFDRDFDFELARPPFVLLPSAI